MQPVHFLPDAKVLIEDRIATGDLDNLPVETRIKLGGATPDVRGGESTSRAGVRDSALTKSAHVSYDLKHRMHTVSRSVRKGCRFRCIEGYDRSRPTCGPRSPTAEAGGLNPLQYGFESRRGHPGYTAS